MDWIASWGDAARTSLGFFWEAGWVFVVGGPADRLRLA